MNIRELFWPAAAGLVLATAPASAERQQQAVMKKVDCHATFAAYDGEDPEFQPVDTKGGSKVKPKAKANSTPRGTPLRPCLVLASA